MLKELVQYLIGLAGPTSYWDGSRYLLRSDYSEVRQPAKTGLVIHTLAGIVHFLRNKVDPKDIQYLVHVASPEEVHVLTGYTQNGNREKLLCAQYDPTYFRFGHYMDQEDFTISLLSIFDKGGHREDLIKLVSNLVKEESVKTTDDGLSQQVTAKSGVAWVSEVTIENPIKLAPFRTFPEVVQPVSNFVFRLNRSKQCVLFEAENSAWRLEAIASISEYLGKSLSDEIKSGKVSLIS